MKKCRNCQGDLKEGEEHRPVKICIQILTARIADLFARLQGSTVPPGQQVWPTA